MRPTLLLQAIVLIASVVLFVGIAIVALRDASWMLAVVLTGWLVAIELHVLLRSWSCGCRGRQQSGVVCSCPDSSRTMRKLMTRSRENVVEQTWMATQVSGEAISLKNETRSTG